MGRKMRGSMATLLLAIAGTGCVAPTRVPQPVTLTLRGVVSDSEAWQPIQFASVRVMRHRDVRLLSTDDPGAVTDSLGAFTVRLPAPGRYYVLVRMIGYRPYWLRVILPEDADRVLRIGLGAQPVFISNDTFPE